MAHNKFLRQRILQQLKTFNWRQRLVAAAFLFVLGFTGFYVYRVVRDAIYWQYHEDEPIQGWMTVDYVAHSYHVPPHILYKSLGLPHKPPNKNPLFEIANTQNRSMDEIKAILQDTIIHARPPYPPSPPPDDEDKAP